MSLGIADWIYLAILGTLFVFMFFMTRWSNRHWKALQEGSGKENELLRQTMLRSAGIQPRISLNEDDFKRLVGGGIVKKEGVEIALKDIGFPQMGKALRDVWES